MIPDEGKGRPSWVQNILGQKYFRKVKAVDFATNRGRKKGTNDPKATDELLAHLEFLDEIKSVELGHNESVTDEQLIYLSPLKNLEAIYLHRTLVTVPGLLHLTNLPQLKYLSLNYTPLTDAGLEHIANIKSLRTIALDNTKVTDDGVAFLTKLKNLESLSLNNTDITDA